MIRMSLQQMTNASLTLSNKYPSQMTCTLRGSFHVLSLKKTPRGHSPRRSSGGKKSDISYNEVVKVSGRLKNTISLWAMYLGLAEGLKNPFRKTSDLLRTKISVDEIRNLINKVKANTSEYFQPFDESLSTPKESVLSKEGTFIIPIVNQNLNDIAIHCSKNLTGRQINLVLDGSDEKVTTEIVPKILQLYTSGSSNKEPLREEDMTSRVNSASIQNPNISKVIESMQNANTVNLIISMKSFCLDPDHWIELEKIQKQLDEIKDMKIRGADQRQESELEKARISSDPIILQRPIVENSTPNTEPLLTPDKLPSKPVLIEGKKTDIIDPIDKSKQVLLNEVSEIAIQAKGVNPRLKRHNQSSYKLRRFYSSMPNLKWKPRITSDDEGGSSRIPAIELTESLTKTLVNAILNRKIEKLKTSYKKDDDTQPDEIEKSISLAKKTKNAKKIPKEKPVLTSSKKKQPKFVPCKECLAIDHHKFVVNKAKEARKKVSRLKVDTTKPQQPIANTNVGGFHFNKTDTVELLSKTETRRRMSTKGSGSRKHEVNAPILTCNLNWMPRSHWSSAALESNSPFEGPLTSINELSANRLAASALKPTNKTELPPVKKNPSTKNNKETIAKRFPRYKNDALRTWDRAGRSEYKTKLRQSRTFNQVPSLRSSTPVTELMADPLISGQSLTVATPPVIAQAKVKQKKPKRKLKVIVSKTSMTRQRPRLNKNIISQIGSRVASILDRKVKETKKVTKRSFATFTDNKSLKRLRGGRDACDPCADYEIAECDKANQAIGTEPCNTKSCNIQSPVRPEIPPKTGYELCGGCNKYKKTNGKDETPPGSPKKIKSGMSVAEAAAFFKKRETSKPCPLETYDDALNLPKCPCEIKELKEREKKPVVKKVTPGLNANPFYNELVRSFLPANKGVRPAIVGYDTNGMPIYAPPGAAFNVMDVKRDGRIIFGPGGPGGPPLPTIRCFTKDGTPVYEPTDPEEKMKLTLLGSFSQDNSPVVGHPDLEKGMVYASKGEDGLVRYNALIPPPVSKFDQDWSEFLEEIGWGKEKVKKPPCKYPLDFRIGTNWPMCIFHPDCLVTPPSVNKSMGWKWNVKRYIYWSDTKPKLYRNPIKKPGCMLGRVAKLIRYHRKKKNLEDPTRLLERGYYWHNRCIPYWPRKHKDEKNYCPYWGRLASRCTCP